MENTLNSFATFKPVELNSSPSKEEIRAYYAQNQINNLDNNFLNSYFDMGSNEFTDSTPVSEAGSGLYDIRGMSKKRYGDRENMSSINTTADAKETAKLIMNFFMEKGLTKEQAAGITGNLHAESGFNTSASGDEGTSFGLAQWHNERGVGLENFTKKLKLPKNSLKGQLEFVWKELNTTHKSALSALQTTRTPTEAARVFSDKFERPKVYNKEREEQANLFYSI